MMKKINLNTIGSVLLLLVGIVLIIFYKRADFMEWLARIVGLVFLMPAVVSLVSVAVRDKARRSSMDYWSMMAALGGFCLGALMLIKPLDYTGMLNFVLGVALVVLGLFQVCYMALAAGGGVKAWDFIVPVLVAAGGIVVLAVDSVRGNQPLVLLLTGTLLVLMSIHLLAMPLLLKRRRKSTQQHVAAQLQ